MLTCHYLGFFLPPISDHVTTKVKYIALSFSPSFPGPPELVDVTLVLVFLYSIGHIFEYNTNLFFLWLWLNIQAHKNLNTAVGIFFGGGGGSGSHLVSRQGSLALSPYEIKFQVIYSIKK